jgi:hypothetical protein
MCEYRQEIQWFGSISGSKGTRHAHLAHLLVIICTASASRAQVLACRWRSRDCGETSRSVAHASIPEPQVAITMVDATIATQGGMD